MPESVGVMGGTFDPIHFGHLAAGEEARVRLGLARVVFVPNGQPPHKAGYAVTDAEHRYNMVVLATASNPHFEVSRVEIDRSGPSYAVDTVRSLARQFAEGTTVHFITGADAILELLTWRDPEQLARFCEFVAVARPGHNLDDIRQALGEELSRQVHYLDIPGIATSSRELRKRAAEGLSLRYLTPDPVARYVLSHRLYRGLDCTRIGDCDQDIYARD